MAKNGVYRFNEREDETYRLASNKYREILKVLGIKASFNEIENKAKVKDGTMFNSFIKNQYLDKNGEPSDELRKRVARAALKQYKSSDKKDSIVEMYLAQMAESYIPYDTVLAAGTMTSQGKSLQMGCGQGKTGVLSFAAYDLISKTTNGKENQVFLTSSTPELAKEMLDIVKDFDALGKAGEMVLIKENSYMEPNLDKNNNLIYETDEKGKKVPSFTEKSFEGMPKHKREEVFKRSIIISDNATLMNHSMNKYLEPATDDKNRVLLSDEADYSLLDSYQPIQKTENLTKSEAARRKILRQEAYKIYESIKKTTEKIFDKDDQNQYVDFTDIGRKRVVDAISAIEGNIDKNLLYEYVCDALTVDTVYKENRDYQILGNRACFVSENRASGVGIDLPQGVKQALLIKLSKEGKYIGNIPPEKAVLDTTNIQNFFKEYFHRRQFISGTLGIDSTEVLDELQKNFGIKKEDILIMQPREKSRLEIQKKELFKTKEEKQDAIVKNALETLNDKNRYGKDKGAVLIGVVSEEELKEVKQKLNDQLKSMGKKRKEEKPRILTYTAAKEREFDYYKKKMSSKKFIEKYKCDPDKYKDYAEFIKNEAGKPNTITLGTSIMGRGLNIDAKQLITKDGEHVKGGLHVIVDGIHETSSRNQEQYIYRAGRGDDPGSAIQMFCLQDGLNDRKTRNNIWEKHKNDPDFAENYYKYIYNGSEKRKGKDQITRSKRDNVVMFVKKSRDILNEIENECQTNGIDEDEVKKARALFLERSFSIRSRALGISDIFHKRVKAYEEELNIYSDLYISKAKFEKENPGQIFDEKEYLISIGKKDFAEIHTPFSKERQQQILKKYYTDDKKEKKSNNEDGKKNLDEGSDLNKQRDGANTEKLQNKSDKNSIGKTQLKEIAEGQTKAAVVTSAEETMQAVKQKRAEREMNPLSVKQEYQK